MEDNNIEQSPRYRVAKVVIAELLDRIRPPVTDEDKIAPRYGPGRSIMDTVHGRSHRDTCNGRLSKYVTEQYQEKLEVQEQQEKQEQIVYYSSAGVHKTVIVINSDEYAVMLDNSTRANDKNSLNQSLIKIKKNENGRLFFTAECCAIM